MAATAGTFHWGPAEALDQTIDELIWWNERARKFWAMQTEGEDE